MNAKITGDDKRLEDLLKEVFSLRVPELSMAQITQLWAIRGTQLFPIKSYHSWKRSVQRALIRPVLKRLSSQGIVEEHRFGDWRGPISPRTTPVFCWRPGIAYDRDAHYRIMENYLDLPWGRLRCAGTYRSKILGPDIASFPQSTKLFGGLADPDHCPFDYSRSIVGWGQIYLKVLRARPAEAATWRFPFSVKGKNILFALVGPDDAPKAIVCSVVSDPFFTYGHRYFERRNVGYDDYVA
jgi:hypothetical protein